MGEALLPLIGEGYLEIQKTLSRGSLREDKSGA